MNILGDPTLKPKLVDLDVSNITLFPEKLNEGEPNSINVTIYNNGTTDVNNFTVAFFLDKKCDEHLIGIDEISVSTDSKRKAQVTWNPSTGKHNIYAVVDLDNNISNVSMNMHWTNKTIYVNSKPIVETISFSRFSLFKEESLTIYVNGSDIENMESKLTCQIQYKAPTGVWIDLDNEKFVIDHWEVIFTPKKDAERGFYDFRVKFIDMDGCESNWLESLDIVEVLSEIPIAINISYSKASVNRTDSIKIYTNGSDVEDEESKLSCQIQYKAATDVWSDLDNEKFNKDHWEANFTPTKDSKLGFYDFRVKFIDRDNCESSWLEDLDAVEVLNNIPSVVDISYSKNSVNRTKSIKIYNNCSDVEDDDINLTCQIQYRAPFDDWIDLDNEKFIGDHWEVNFFPLKDAMLGLYDFRVKFTDKDGNQSSWLENLDVVNVLNNAPNVIDISYSSIVVFRANSIRIYANGNDIEDEEFKQICQIQYRTPTGVWTDLDNENFIGDRWEVNFLPLKDATVGLYDFRVKFTDKDGNQSSWLEDLGIVEVKNNNPNIIDFYYSKNYVFRTEPVTIFADANDLETEKKDLVCEMQYKSPLDSWKDLDDNFIHDRCEVVFTPNSTEEIGFYNFRVRFSDEINKTDWLICNKDLEVKNNLPKIDDFYTSSSTVFRSKSVKIYLKGSDIETQKKDLRCEIQYQPLLEEWKDLIVNFNNNQWDANFAPENELGFYNFRARLIDEESSDWSNNIKLLVKNNAPIVNTVKNQTVFLYDIVNFNCFASDIDGEIVKYEWDFDMNGIYDYSSKNKDSATYKYEIIGTYYAKLRVIDNDGTISEGTCKITVKPKVEEISISLKLSRNTCNVNENIIVFGEVKSGDFFSVNIKVKITVDNSFEWITTTDSYGKYNLTITIQEKGDYTINATVLTNSNIVYEEAELKIEDNIKNDEKENASLLLIFAPIIIVIIFVTFIFRKNFKKKPNIQKELLFSKK